MARIDEYGYVTLDDNTGTASTTGTHNNSRNSGGGHGFTVVLGILICAAVLWFVIPRIINKQNDSAPMTETESAVSYYSENEDTSSTQHYNGYSNASTSYDYGTSYTNDYSTSYTNDYSTSYTNDYSSSYTNDYGTINMSTEENSESDEYILPNSDSSYISYSDLYGLSQTEVALARNEIYARHGRKFSKDSIRKYFESKSWYKPYIDPADFSDSVFNIYEKSNIKTILDYEKEKGWR